MFQSMVRLPHFISFATSSHLPSPVLFISVSRFHFSSKKKSIKMCSSPERSRGGIITFYLIPDRFEHNKDFVPPPQNTATDGRSFQPSRWPTDIFILTEILRYLPPTNNLLSPLYASSFLPVLSLYYSSTFLEVVGNYQRGVNARVNEMWKSKTEEDMCRNIIEAMSLQYKYLLSYRRKNSHIKKSGSSQMLGKGFDFL